jgi:hypothetical protein
MDEKQPEEKPELIAPLDITLETGRPDPQWIRGTCPECGEVLVSNLYYIGGKGYILVWQCWASLGEKPTCSYQKVL